MSVEVLTTLQKLLGTAIVILSFWIAQFYWKWRDLHRKSKQFEIAPHYWPVIGHALQFAGNIERVLTNIQRLAVSNKNVIAWLGPELIVSVGKPDDIDYVFNNCLGKSGLYDFTKTIVGNGIFSAPVHIWKPNRKMIATTFNQKILDSFVDIFVEQSNYLVSILRNEMINCNLKIEEFLTNTTLTTICATTMGYTTDKAKNYAIGKAMHKVMEIAFKRMVNLNLRLECLFKFTKMHDEMRNGECVLHNHVLSILAKRKREIQDNECRYDINGNGLNRKTFIELLLDMNKKNEQFSDDQIKFEATTLLLAGSDTSATVLSYTCIMLGMHPKIQEKVYEEVMDVLGPSKVIEHTDLPKLKYMEMVLKETMRLFPVGPNILRTADKDVTLPCGKTIPNGSTILIPILSVHRSAEFYPEPLKFDPERFLPEECSKRHPCTYIPFSGGPRNCIGIKYGMMTMKCFLSNMIRNFKFHTYYKSIEEIRLQQQIVLTPVEGYKVYLTER